MYSQQHTVPMTGEGGDNSGTGWTCTQPITSQKKQGFLQRLSDRPFSLKAVSKPVAAVEEDSAKEGQQLRNWGSYENILEESAALQRSPSLPILNMKPVTSSQLLRGSHFPCHTPKQSLGSLYGNSETTPQKHVPPQCPLSAKVKQFAQDLHSKVDQTPQQHTQSQTFNRTMSAQRGPLQSITPKQLYLSEMQQQKSTLKVEKENCMPVQDQMLNPIKEETLSPWKQELLQEMKSGSPILLTTSKPQPTRSTSPPGVMRSLFNETPLKQNIQGLSIDSLQQDQKSLKSVSNGYGSTRDNMYAGTENAVSLRPSNEIRNNFNNKPAHFAAHTPRQITDPDIKQSVSLDPVQKAPEHTFKHPPPKSADSGAQNIIVVNHVPYIIGHRLGRGGSSEVYQVNRQSDNQVLAIKCVDLRNVDDQIRAGYLNEITMLQRMQGSPLVVNLIDYELCEARQMLFVVMEKGACDLASFIKDVSRRRDMKLSTILAFWKDMVEAVAAIHERGIIHSDLKPANFLVVGEVGFHQLKLIDFGIASSVQSDMTSVVRESPAGTLNYMSPEAVQGMHGQQSSRVKINYKSDIWSLGCILYNLLYGRTPFQQVTHPTLKADAICNPRHVIEFPARSPTLPGDGCVSSPLLQTVQACLTRDPNARPTAKQLLAIKYCGCNEAAMQSLEPLIYGLLSVIRSHPLGREFSTRIISALQEDGKQDRPGGH